MTYTFCLQHGKKFREVIVTAPDFFAAVSRLHKSAVKGRVTSMYSNSKENAPVVLK